MESVVVYGSAAPALLGAQDVFHGEVEWAAPGLNQAASLITRQIAEPARRAGTPVVLFSGGVDSSLIALKLRDLGRYDTLLVHYSFDPRDNETLAATEIARHLGLRLEVVDPSQRLMTCLEAPGEVWPAPFADQSTVATYDLCQRLKGLVDPSNVVVFDGTGADGGFGLQAKLSQLKRAYELPSFVPRLGSSAYRLGAWRARGTLEYRARALRRLAVLGPGGASIAQNSLFGIAYDAQHTPDIDRGLQTWLDASAPDLDVRTVLVDLVVTCAAVFAQKTYGPLTHHGFEVCYPFLGDDVVRLALATVSEQRRAPAKAWLKQELVRVLPANLVERRKTGFIDPRKAMFTESALIDAIERSYGPDGFAHAMGRPRQLDRIVKDLRHAAIMPHGHLNLMWALGFLQRWIETQPKTTFSIRQL